MVTTNKRFSIDKEGDVHIQATIPHAELADLPECVMFFLAETLSNNSLSAQARESLALMLRALSKFFPNEFEQREICKQLEKHDTRKSGNKAQA